MLNDLSTFTRVTSFFQVFPFGMLLGALWMSKRTSGLSAFLTVCLLVVVALVVWCIVFVTWTRVSWRRLHDEVARGSAEIVQHGLAAHVVPARVVRTRNWRGMRPWALGAMPPNSGTWSVAFTVLPPGEPARRVAALIPLSLAKGTTALLALHPGLREVGVIDLRVTRDQLARAQQDPRWLRESLPTDRTVVGGWSLVLISALFGILAGAAVAIVLMRALA